MFFFLFLTSLLLKVIFIFLSVLLIKSMWYCLVKICTLIGFIAFILYFIKVVSVKRSDFIEIFYILYEWCLAILGT